MSPWLTDPKPPDNLSDEGVSPKNDLTVNGAPVDEEIGTLNANRGHKIKNLLGLLKNSSPPSKNSNPSSNPRYYRGTIIMAIGDAFSPAIYQS